MRKESLPRMEIQKKPEYFDLRAGLDKVIDIIKAREQQTVVIVFGTPGSGKTYFIKQLESALDKDGWNITHIDSYKSDHSYEYVANFKVFIIHAGGARDYKDTQNTILEKIGRNADLSVYVKNELVLSKIDSFAQTNGQDIEKQCEIVILNFFQE